MNYSVVSISNCKPAAWYYLFDEYFRSIELTGAENPLVFQPQHWGGLSTKPKLLYQLIKNKTINTEHIIFTDCWDLVFAAHPDEIMETYFSFGSPIVISAESNCFPDDLKEEFNKRNPPTKYKYLNSGFICGETEALLFLLEEMDLPNLPDDYFDPVQGKNIHPNDQFEFQKLAIKHPDIIELDYNQILSQTLHDATIDEFDLTGGRIRNKNTGTYPCTFHFNGGSKDNLSLRNPILKFLRLA